MEGPLCDGSFSSFLGPRQLSRSEEGGVLPENSSTGAGKASEDGIASCLNFVSRPAFTKCLAHGCLLFACLLVGFTLGTLYGPGIHVVTPESEQEAPYMHLHNFSFHRGAHARRLFLSEPDERSTESPVKPPIGKQVQGDGIAGGSGNSDNDRLLSLQGSKPTSDATDVARSEVESPNLVSPSSPNKDGFASDGKQVQEQKRKRRLEHANGPDPHTYRSQLCTLLRREKALQEWYALIVLYITEWPTNARRGNGGDAFIDSLRNLAKNFKAPRHATMHVQLMFADETTCGTPSFFLEGLSTVAKDIHCHGDLIKVMQKYSEIVEFADLVQYTQVTKLPADISISAFPWLLRAAFEGFSFCFSRKLYFKGVKSQNGSRKSGETKGTGESTGSKRTSGSVTISDLYKAYVKEYQQNEFQYSLLLLMANVMKRIVSSRPHAGIMVLKFDSAEALTLSRGRNAKDKAAIDSLQRSVAVGVEGKLDRSLQRFHTFHSVISPLMVAPSVMRPYVSVTGYLERTRDGNFVDHGIFGMDMDTNTLEELKGRMEPGNLLVDVSLVDPWSSRPVSEWPNPLQRDLLGLTAYTATQLLCAELQWDPSLGTLGHVEVVYSGLADVYSLVGGGQQPRAKFDPDVQVLLLRDNQKFVEDGLEDGSKKIISNLVAQEPLGSEKKAIGVDRIEWRGIARLLTEGQLYRKNAFGMGLPPALRRSAERTLRPNVVLIHISIRGLGHLTPEALGFDMTANEMAGRLVRRSRGIYDAVLIKAETPAVKEMSLKSEQKCVGDIPKWVVLVASLSVALFFIILITLLLYHDKIKLPWWIMCICSSRAPWEESSSPSNVSHIFASEALGKQSNSTRDIIAFAPALKDTLSSI